MFSFQRWLRELAAKAILAGARDALVTLAGDGDSEMAASHRASKALLNELTRIGHAQATLPLLEKGGTDSQGIPPMQNAPQVDAGNGQARKGPGRPRKEA